MKARQLVDRYMEIFYGERDPRHLYEVLAADLRFIGPFAAFDSAEAYIRSLENDPPLGMTFAILDRFESGNKTCLIYQFEKGDLSLPMAQVFTIDEEKISDIRLIFDGREFGS